MYFVKKALKISPLKTDDWTTNTNSEFFYQINNSNSTSRSSTLWCERLFKFWRQRFSDILWSGRPRSVKNEGVFVRVKESIEEDQNASTRRGSHQVWMSLQWILQKPQQDGVTTQTASITIQLLRQMFGKRVISPDCGTKWPPRTRFWQTMISFYRFISKKSFMLISFRFFNIWNTTFGQNSDHYSQEH